MVTLVSITYQMPDSINSIIKPDKLVRYLIRVSQGACFVTGHDSVTKIINM